jgi:hypothetical protein
MKVRVLAMVIMFALCSVTSYAKSTKRRTVDVVQTFRTLDKHFTILDAHLQDLQKGINAPATQKKAGGRSWRTVTKQMRRTTLRIERISSSAATRYRRQRNRTGTKMFGSLHVRAKTLNRHLLSLSKAPSRDNARKSIPRVQQAVLNLVLQFQVMSGGYAATRCDPGTWSCGVPKQELDQPGYPKVGVKWTCVKRAKGCGGMLGAWTPPLVTKPVTVANTQTR